MAAVQEALNFLGYDAGPVDGIYGAQTQQAVIQFQQVNGLPAQGVVGPQTTSHLDTALRQFGGGYNCGVFA